jgi:phosphoribosylformylglycinamidine synthase
MSESWPREPAAPSVALCQNLSARFHDAWTRVTIPSETRCIWTRGLETDSETGLLPSAHGEGRLITDAATLQSLQRNGQIAVRYADGENFNGSMDSIAGICDPSGLVFGLMPHPERFTRWTQHPWWTRLDDARRSDAPLGLRMFRQAIAVAREPLHRRTSVVTA